MNTKYELLDQRFFLHEQQHRTAVMTLSSPVFKAPKEDMLPNV